MGRRYSLETLAKLESNARWMEYNGLKILLKPIPEGGEDGDMDPRLYNLHSLNL